VLTLSAALVVAGCHSVPLVKRLTGAVAGPYTVTVTDASSGRPVPYAVVEWDYSFTSKRVESTKQRDWGISIATDGIARIPEMEHPSGDAFREMRLSVTAARFVEAKITVKSKSGALTVPLTPVQTVVP
jgi:hypothetical protein